MKTASSRPAAAHSAVVQTALETYYNRFAEDDWPTIVRMFELPALVVSGERRLLLDSSDAVTRMYEGLRAKFINEGVAGVSWDRDSLVVYPVHDDLVVARVVLTRFGKTGAPVKTWTCSYTLRHKAGTWLISLITSDERTSDQRQNSASQSPR